MPDAYFDASHLIWHHEDRFFGEVFLHLVEGLLSGIVPNEGLVFLVEFVHGLSEFGEFPNEVLIEVSKSKERAYLFYALGDWPVVDSIEFGGVYHHLAFFDNKAKVFNLCFAEFIFQWFEVEIGFSEVSRTHLVKRSRFSLFLAKMRMLSMYMMQNPFSISSLRVSFIIA